MRGLANLLNTLETNGSLFNQTLNVSISNDEGQGAQFSFKMRRIPVAQRENAENSADSIANGENSLGNAAVRGFIRGLIKRLNESR